MAFKQTLNRASEIYQAQNRQIHKALAAIGMPYGENKESLAYLLGEFCGRRKARLSALTLGQRRELLQHLKKSVQVFNPFVPAQVAGWKKGHEDVEIRHTPQAPLKGGFKGGVDQKGFPGKPAEPAMKDWQRGKMLGKIEAMLAEASRPWSYAHGLAKKMFGIDRVEWCDATQVHKIVSAMVYDAKRHGRKTG